MQKTLKSYFFWTHQRGSFHYDVMVTLILLFIFVTPMPFMRGIINYGDKAPTSGMLVEPITVVGDGQYGLILTVPAQIIQLDPDANIKTVRKALHQAIQHLHDIDARAECGIHCRHFQADNTTTDNQHALRNASQFQRAG